MSTRGPTSYSLRLLICQQCGAPVESAPAGGHFTCTYCHATHQVPPRDERPETFAGSGQLDLQPAATEAERFAAMRAQGVSMNAYYLPPNGLLMLARHSTDVSRVAEAEGLFRSALVRVHGGAGFEAEAALFWSVGILRTMYLTQKDALRARAIDEMTLEALTDPVFRTIQRVSLANRACEARDLDSAEAWLAPCPRDSSVLIVHTVVRIAEARMAYLRGDYERTLERLGARAGAVPIAPQHDATACLYRAAAYEKLGRLDEAKTALADSRRDLGSRLTALKKITSFRETFADEELCPQSFPTFRRRVRLSRMGCAGVLLLILLVGVFGSFYKHV